MTVEVWRAIAAAGCLKCDINTVLQLAGQLKCTAPEGPPPRLPACCYCLCCCYCCFRPCLLSRVRLRPHSSGWQHDFAKSFTKMVGLGVRWSKTAFYPTWKECKSFVLAPGAAPGTRCDCCKQLGALRVAEPSVVGPPGGYQCPAGCVCQGEYSKNAVSWRQQQSQAHWATAVRNDSKSRCSSSSSI
jgi:hypothetical protein